MMHIALLLYMPAQCSMGWWWGRAPLCASSMRHVSSDNHVIRMCIALLHIMNERACSHLVSPAAGQQSDALAGRTSCTDHGLSGNSSRCLSFPVLMV